MSDLIVTSDKPVEKAKPTGPTAAQALEHLNAVEKHAMTFVGKDGCNPYLWLQQYKVAELKGQLNSAQGIEAAMSVPLKEPKVADLPQPRQVN